MRLAVGCILLATACGPVESTEEVLDRAADPIVNGQNAMGDPAVVGLTDGSHLFCTGTLITPSIVLTAAHCLPPNTPVAEAEIQIYFGSGVGPGEHIPAHDAWANPLWNDDEWYEDIGLVQMKQVAAAPPVPLNTTPIMDNASVRIVGFGVTSEAGSDSGIKREGTAIVTSSDTFALEISPSPSSTCYGDSGGPTMAMQGGVEHVAGVHSRGSCGFEGIDMRVDAYLTMINAFIAMHPEPACGADGLCAAPCDGSIDPDCPCADDGLCTTACADAVADPDCAEQCGPNGTCNESCGIPDPDCSVCAADGQCVESCANDPDCPDPCDPETGCCGDDCDDGEVVDQGCGCRMHRRDTGGPLATVMALLGVWLVRRRRPHG